MWLWTEPLLGLGVSRGPRAGERRVPGRWGGGGPFPGSKPCAAQARAAAATSARAVAAAGVHHVAGRPPSARARPARGLTDTRCRLPRRPPRATPDPEGPASGRRGERDRTRCGGETEARGGQVLGRMDGRIAAAERPCCPKVRESGTHLALLEFCSPGDPELGTPEPPSLHLHWPRGPGRSPRPAAPAMTPSDSAPAWRRSP